MTIEEGAATLGCDPDELSLAVTELELERERTIERRLVRFGEGNFQTKYQLEDLRAALARQAARRLGFPE